MHTQQRPINTFLVALSLTVAAGCTHNNQENSQRVDEFDATRSDTAVYPQDHDELRPETAIGSTVASPVVRTPIARTNESNDQAAGVATVQVQPKPGDNRKREQPRLAEATAVPGRQAVAKQRALHDQATSRYHPPVAAPPVYGVPPVHSTQPVDREGYEPLIETGFRDPRVSPLSTFSADVDTASYSNVRRFLNEGRLPPADAVRLEEMINYFDYSPLAQRGDHPFATQVEMASAPWAPAHQLAMIRLQSRSLTPAESKPNRLVFLIDSSGSMRSPDKLPLLQRAFSQLSGQLGSRDRIAIVTYAGHAGLVLPSTAGSDHYRIEQALRNLHAGGSTAGSAGIELAYEIARQQFDPEANNRVVLATDGDFNVGPSSSGELVRLIENQRERGVYLTVLGFGRGNLQDDRMHRLADHGDGQYHYIDSDREAYRVLVEKLRGTLETVARDVKLQVEFNPAHVSRYRLLGYETRRMNAEDFRNDRKDGGEMGSGHSMIALYEIIPHGAVSTPDYDDQRRVPALQFQPSPATDGHRHPVRPASYQQWLAFRVRYEQPEGGTAREFLTRTTAAPGQPSADWQWAANVAEFALSLRQSSYRGSANLHRVMQRARQLSAAQPDNARNEFVGLVQRATQLAPQLSRHDMLGDNG